LEENPLHKQCSNQHGRWALRVVSDPSRLAKIRNRHPLQNYILKDESLKAVLFAWFLPVITPNALSMRKLKEPISQQLVNQIREALITGVLAPLPQFQRYSTTRGTGVAILPGDRFVHPDTIDKISEDTIESLLRTWDTYSPHYFSISKQYSFPTCPHWQFPRVAVLCFPLVVLGSGFDCETVTIRISRADSKDLPLHIWKGISNPSMYIYTPDGAPILPQPALQNTSTMRSKENWSLIQKSLKLNTPPICGGSNNSSLKAPCFNSLHSSGLK